MHPLGCPGPLLRPHLETRQGGGISAAEEAMLHYLQLAAILLTVDHTLGSFGRDCF